MNTEELQKLRQDYLTYSLNEKDVNPDPFLQFGKWLDEALKAGLPEPNAMTLATVNADNQPQARIVLLKGIVEKGFIFYTNYASDKGRELANNPNAALCFLWIELERQVRIQGEVIKLSEKESEAYFKRRPYKSQIGALASNQSNVVENRAYLEKKFSELEKKYPEGTVPKPESWGGYVVQPVAIEFWQGRRSRLHDRIKYFKDNGTWIIKRLSP